MAPPEGFGLAPVIVDGGGCQRERIVVGRALPGRDVLEHRHELEVDRVGFPKLGGKRQLRQKCCGIAGVGIGVGDGRNLLQPVAQAEGGEAVVGVVAGNVREYARCCIRLPRLE